VAAPTETRNTQLAPSETKSLIEECGWKGGDRGQLGGRKTNDQQKPHRTNLTPTGLLMEGDFTQNPSWRVNE
jgi:hypothetical protein